MSGSLTPTSDQETRAKVTRTVGIIKNHALKHRMSIERRIEEASFEIVKERQMEFDVNSDTEFLTELFGNDTQSLFEGPVWVYVLERRRAAEVWNALMGEEDPERARVNSANSLRAIYGVDLAQNAVMGSPSTDVAEEQISCLFQSSPPFLPQEPDELDEMDSMAQRLSLDTQGESYQDQDHMLSPTSSQLSARLTSSGSRNETSLTSNSSSERKAVTSSNGKVPFKARPVPKTHLTPDITPRTTKSAALRAGLPVTPVGLKGPRVIPTKEETKQAFLDVPGHKRSSTIQVASTAAPTIAPRMSRAAELRLTKRTMSTPTGNFAPPTKPKARPSVSNGNIFEGIPGHKRRESISVASVQAPIVSPRLNKSSALRAKRDSAPPTSFMFHPPVEPKLPGGLSRSTTSSSLSPLRPSSAMSGSVGSSRPGSSLANTGTTNGRFSSVGRHGAQSMTRTLSQGSENGSASPARLMPPRPPSIEPRTNKSALLRAKAGGQANAPSSFNGKKPGITRRASITA